MTATTTPRALREYRALTDPIARGIYDPTGKPGAEAVRRLQLIAYTVSALRDARHQTRTNPQYPAWKADWARGEYRRVAGPETALARAIGRDLVVVPLGPEDAALARRLARAAHPRRQNWESVEGTLSGVQAGDCVAHGFFYKGRHKGRLGTNWAPAMRAVARVSLDGQIMAAVIGHAGGADRPEAVHTILAGRGYRWETDAHGVRLVRLADGADYHPTTDDVRAGRAAIVAALREREATRRARARVARHEAAILRKAAAGGVWVSLADSVAGGNCQAGTEMYARRHGLDLRRHYRADALPAPATAEESRRVALAVLAATRRQAREWAAGVCAL